MEEPRQSPIPDDAGGTDYSMLDRLDRWVADARSADAAASRTRAHWLAVQADESATFLGLLVDVAERQVPLIVDGPAGRKHRLTVSSVGCDFCIGRADDGREVLLALAAVAAVRMEPGHKAATGDRTIEVDLTMAEAIAAAATDKPWVLVVTMDGTSVPGELIAAGRDVVSVRQEGAMGTTYVPMAAIGMVRLVEH